jgi:Icc protein
MPSTSPLHVIQLSDTHLFAALNRELLGVATASSLNTVLNAVRQLQPRPEVMLLTGDLSQDESLESYQHLYKFIQSLDIPAYWLPGNHDCLPLMEQLLVGSSISTAKTFQIAPWNFILLNSAQPGKVHGELSSSSLDWLEQQLQQRLDQPTVVALHHPPCSIGSAWMDQIGLRQPEAFTRLIERYQQVKLVLFGHIHQEFATTRMGVHYLGCPSTCVQFRPQQSEFAVDEQQPGFRLLTLYPNGEFSSVVKRVNYQPAPDLAATGY